MTGNMVVGFIQTSRFRSTCMDHRDTAIVVCYCAYRRNVVKRFFYGFFYGGRRDFNADRAQSVLLYGRCFCFHHLRGEDPKENILQGGPAFAIEALQGGDFVGLYAQ